MRVVVVVVVVVIPIPILLYDYLGVACPKHVFQMEGIFSFLFIF